MSVAMSQSAEAALLDRRDPGVGLRVVFAVGTGGRYLALPYAEWSESVFVRFAFRVDAWAGGGALMGGAQHAEAGEVWSLELDPAGSELRLRSPWAETISAALPGMGRWATVEVGYERGGAGLGLWINGIEVGRRGLAAQAAGVEAVWLGGLFKSPDAAGVLSLDEWAVGNRYWGPVRVEPASEYANDPARWLVVYNTAAAESAAWVECYRQARRVPLGQLLGIALPGQEVIGWAAYQALREAVEGYLDRNGLRESVLGVLLGHGVPGYVQDPGVDQVVPIGSLLHKAAAGGLAEGNPVGLAETLTRPTAASLQGIRLTARIDGADFARSMELTERAESLAGQVLPGGDRLWVDRLPGGSSLALPAEQLAAWSEGLDRQRLRLETVSNVGEADGGADYSVIERDACYWGWNERLPAEGFFGEPAGSRVVYVQLRLAGGATAADSVRGTATTNWVEAALAAGYAAVIASSRVDSSGVVPRPGPFFEALRRGWTLGEAWLLAQPFVGTGYYLVGDPLLTVGIPGEGWDVYGPLARAEDLVPGQPLAALPLGQTEHALGTEAVPGDGETALYLVQRRGGREGNDSGFRALRAGRQNGAASGPPPVVAWPTRSGWRWREGQGGATAVLLLAERLPAGMDVRVELLTDAAEASGIVAAVGRDARVVEVPLDTVSEPTRYRWRVAVSGGLPALTPWSAVRDADVSERVSITLLES
ncbi:MAG: hypothetical protein AAGG38_04220 [Planctomycetota bacterium]